MDVMPAGGVMDATAAMAVDVTAAGVIRCRQVNAKDVRVSVEKAVTVRRLTVRRGTA